MTDTDIMRSYAIDTLFDSEYYTGDTEEIETADALKAPDSDPFIIAIQREVHSLITATRTLIPITRGAADYLENTTNKRIWKIRTTLNCKRKKKPNRAQVTRRSPRRHTPTLDDKGQRSTTT